MVLGTVVSLVVSLAFLVAAVYLVRWIWFS